MLLRASPIWNLIAKSRMKYCIDSMYGAGRHDPVRRSSTGSASRMCRSVSNPDPLFPGINPEPIEPHIRALGEAMVANGCQAGLFTDGGCGPNWRDG